jgi:hypothetical protein
MVVIDTDPETITPSNSITRPAGHARRAATI